MGKAAENIPAATLSVRIDKYPTGWAISPWTEFPRRLWRSMGVMAWGGGYLYGIRSKKLARQLARRAAVMLARGWGSSQVVLALTGSKLLCHTVGAAAWKRASVKEIATAIEAQRKLSGPNGWAVQRIQKILDRRSPAVLDRDCQLASKKAKGKKRAKARK